jgi:hypothetical protein
MINLKRILNIISLPIAFRIEKLRLRVDQPRKGFEPFRGSHQKNPMANRVLQANEKKFNLYFKLNFLYK